MKLDKLFLFCINQKIKKIYNRCNKRAIQKTAEATGDLIDDKIADKITSISKKPSIELPNNNNSNNNNNNNNEDVEITARKKRYISPEERQQIIDELRLVPKKDAYF